MVWVRRILQVISLLFALLFAWIFWAYSSPSDSSIWPGVGLVAVFVFFALILGPLCPTVENIKRWNLDNEKQLYYLVPIFPGIGFLFMAWNTYMDPVDFLHSTKMTRASYIDQVLFNLGDRGLLVIYFLVIGGYCFWKAYASYKRYNSGKM